MKIILKERRRSNWYITFALLVIFILSIVVIWQYLALQKAHSELIKYTLRKQALEERQGGE